jgi:hypothetical protein
LTHTPWGQEKGGSLRAAFDFWVTLIFLQSKMIFEGMYYAPKPSIKQLRDAFFIRDAANGFSDQRRDGDASHFARLRKFIAMIDGVRDNQFFQS